MARMRIVKPELFTSSQVVECSRDARLLFVGLLCFCDDAGIHPADYRRLKLEVFPGDDCTSLDVKRWLTELLCVKLVDEYKAENKDWWQVTGWERHQRIDQPTFKYPHPNGVIPPSVRRRPQRLGDSLDVHRTINERSGRNGTERNGTDYVRSFVAADHLEVWPEARRLANVTAKKLWPRATRLPEPKDQQLLLRVAFLAKTLFFDDWLADAVGGATGPKVKNRAAYLTRILSATARKRGYDLHELLDAIEIPPKPAAEEKPGLETVNPEIGKLP